MDVATNLATRSLTLAVEKAKKRVSEALSRSEAGGDQLSDISNCIRQAHELLEEAHRLVVSSVLD